MNDEKNRNLNVGGGGGEKTEIRRLDIKKIVVRGER
jgi:hypothetical protein